MDIELDSDPIPLLQIADALDGIPGTGNAGVSPTERAALFSYLEAPARAKWLAMHNMHITRRHTLRVAVMRHCHIGLHAEPTPHQLLSTLQAAAAGTIRP